MARMRALFSPDSPEGGLAGRPGEIGVLSRAARDVARLREPNRQRRIRWSVATLGSLSAWLWWRLVAGRPVSFGWPRLADNVAAFVPQFLLLALFAAVLLVPLLVAGRSAHIRIRPGQIDICFDDVVGMDVVMEEVVPTLNLFLDFRSFREEMGGNPRRAILFEGPAGTGKTYMAKAMAREAEVPFLFVSSSGFQSMYHGQTNHKIRAFFRDLSERRPGGRRRDRIHRGNGRHRRRPVRDAGLASRDGGRRTGGGAVGGPRGHYGSRQ